MSAFHTVVTRISAVDPVGGPAGASGAGGASALAPAPVTLPPAANPAQADRFSQMLESVRAHNTADPQGLSHPSAVSEFVTAQDRAFVELGGSVDTFARNVPHMSMPEMTAQMVDLQYRVTQAMIKVEVGIGFAQGGKGAVQNLMKSQ
jgi:type III secretion system HrpB2-like protein